MQYQNIKKNNIPVTNPTGKIATITRRRYIFADAAGSVHVIIIIHF